MVKIPIRTVFLKNDSLFIAAISAEGQASDLNRTSRRQSSQPKNLHEVF